MLAYMNMNEQYLFVFSLFMAMVLIGKVSADGCKTMEFPESYFFNGKALVGFVLKTIQVADESQCRAQCYMTKNDHCLSYNYIPERLTCELSQSDHRVHPDNLVARQGSLYKASKNGCSCTRDQMCLYNFTTNSHRCKYINGSSSASLPTTTKGPSQHASTSTGSNLQQSENSTLTPTAPASTKDGSILNTLSATLSAASTVINTGQVESASATPRTSSAGDMTSVITAQATIHVTAAPKPSVVTDIILSAITSASSFIATALESSPPKSSDFVLGSLGIMTTPLESSVATTLVATDPTPVSISITIQSGKDMYFEVNGAKYTKGQYYGINFLIVNQDGTIYGDAAKATGFDIQSDKTLQEAKNYITSIPDGKIVLMTTSEEKHMPSKSSTFNELEDSFRSIGSKKRFGEIKDSESWSLIGYKGGDKTWVKEKLSSLEEEVLSGTITPSNP